MLTETIQDPNIARFRAFFERYEQQLNGQPFHPIHNIKRNAAQRLEQLTFPTRRDEDYKYTSFARVLNQEYQVANQVEISADQLATQLVSGLDAYLVVFVNGIFNAQLSTISDLESGLQICSIEDALEDANSRAFVEEQLTANTNTDNPFVVLNTALAQDGIFIKVTKNSLIEKPIHLVHYNTKETQPFICHPQRYFQIESSAEVTVIDSHFGEPAASYFSNVVNVFDVAANAKVTHYKLQTESEQAYQINNTTSYQAKDSIYTNLALDLGGRIIRNNLSAIHQGQNITSNLYGAFVGQGDQHIDHQTFIDHAVPHCESNELYKGVLDGKSHGVFNGKVMVRKDAQKTNAYQQNAALVLSEKAVMDSKPQLEIYADDVKCSHGATIGQLDEGSMFYLRSRGMTTQMAKDTLQYAFIIEVLEQLDDELVQNRAEELIYQKFSH